MGEIIGQQSDTRFLIERQEIFERRLLYRNIAALKRQCFRTAEPVTPEYDRVRHLMIRQQVSPDSPELDTILEGLRYKPRSILKPYRSIFFQYKCRYRPFRRMVLLPGRHDVQFTDEIGQKTAISLDLREYEIDCCDRPERSQHLANIRKSSHIRHKLNIRAQSIYGQDACHRDCWLQYIEDLQDIEDLQIECEWETAKILQDEQTSFNQILEQFIEGYHRLTTPFFRAMVESPFRYFLHDALVDEMLSSAGL